MKKAQNVKIDPPALPRYRKVPKRVDNGSAPHQFATPKDYFRSQCYQVCDLLLGELDKWFKQCRVTTSILTVERLLLSNCPCWLM